MSEHLFLLLFLAFFAAEIAINLLLDFLNRKSIQSHPSVPGFFKPHIDDETYQKSRRYVLAKLSFSGWQTLYSSVVTLLVLFSGLLPAFQTFLSAWDTGLTVRGVAFFFGLSAVLGILRYPMGIYETFRIEAAFGFNRMTLGLYLMDTLKSVVLSALIGAPVLAVVLWFMNIQNGLWWLWVFLFLAAFQIFMLLLYPAFIAPLFNKFKPLEEGSLRQALLETAAKVRFPASDILVMDGSRRSAHSNAYFTGFGKMRRIVLYDTLIAQMSTEELCSVLCHEMGHFKMGHIYKRLLTGFAIQASVLYVLSFLIDWAPMYRAFGFETELASLRHAGLFLFTTAASTFAFVLAPFMNHRSRKHEFEADRFAARYCGSSGAMASALIKLAEKNLSNLTPHPWYSAFHYSHPTVHERVRAIEADMGAGQSPPAPCGGSSFDTAQKQSFPRKAEGS